MKFQISTAHNIIEDTSYELPETQYIRNLHMDGIHVVSDSQDNYECEGNFSLELLEKNNKKVFVPYIGINKIESLKLSYSKLEYFRRLENETVKYLGVFLTEQKAKNVTEIIKLMVNLNHKILKYGLNEKEKRVFLKENEKDLEKLGGVWVPSCDGIEGFTFLDENNEAVYFDNTLNYLSKIGDNNIYSANITPTKKMKKKLL